MSRVNGRVLTLALLVNMVPDLCEGDERHSTTADLYSHAQKKMEKISAEQLRQTVEEEANSDSGVELSAVVMVMAVAVGV
ncbi:hypothetical protein Bca52824_023576 [Brassica carinata]|uniref:Uncharacterized protein n=1 Tax=Brassica carinata TaxID=52824 RepID=A0A8X7VIR7_BRACI|nr:hypothetical protein Bca52824_023576 [Brassica carinata]